MNFTSLIHPDGWKFFGLSTILTLFLYTMNTTVGHLGLVITCWVFYFFRNPKRMTPVRSGLVISPADGKIVGIKEMVPPEEFDMPQVPHYRVSIFLNVFDVHINRIPMSGTVKNILYTPGRFINASLDKASDFNERNTIVMSTSHGDIAFTQIAGLIARRIRCDISDGDEVEIGLQYGLIRFGSRMDVYFPKTSALLVSVGQRMIAGETVLADFDSNESDREAICVEAF